MLKLLFWLVALVDAAALGLMFLLGLAAAGPSKTSPIPVVFFFLLPAVLLLGAVVLFLRAQSGGMRVTAFLLAASPLLFVAAQMANTAWTFQQYRTEAGGRRYFRPGASQEIEDAIAANDAAAVGKALAAGANVNEKGRDGGTLLQAALRQLRQTPERLEVLRALVRAGADPNAGSGELPLTMAIQTSRKTGAEPVRLLLEAGANPNARTEFGEPVFFSGSGSTVPLEVLTLLLDKGADLQATGRSGNNALGVAAAAQNWKALMILLERGADPQLVKTPMGQSLLEKLEADLRVYGDKGGLAEAIARLKP
jgi:hypothetical protein